MKHKSFLLPLVCSALFVSLETTAQKKNEKTDSSNSSSYFDLNAGVSNGFFTPKTTGTATAVAQSRLFYTGGLGYYDASGFNISLLGMMTKDNGQFTLYQTAVSPAFDFNKGKEWGGSISYTRYFSKDSVSFDLSPLKNELYGSLTYKPGAIVPSLALDYAFGTQKDVLTTQRRTVTKSSSVHDISVIASAKHVFDLGSVFSGDDNFTFTPNIMSIIGTNTYGSNLLGSNVPRFTSNKRANRLANGTTASNFAVQYVSVYFEFEYEIGKIYIQPQVLFDYTVPKAESQWNTIFSLTAGISF